MCKINIFNYVIIIQRKYSFLKEKYAREKACKYYIIFKLPKSTFLQTLSLLL